MNVFRRQTVRELWHQWSAGLTRGGRLQPVRTYQQGDQRINLVHKTAQCECSLECNNNMNAAIALNSLFSQYCAEILHNSLH